MHILKAYVPTSVKSIERIRGSVVAEVIFGEGVRVTVARAAYDGAGKMAHVESETVDALDGETRSFDFAVGDADEVRVFVLNDDHVPLCAAAGKRLKAN